jgi:UDP-N-acetylmuramoyl-tripeptide--D-alanyl-D-alanine ligase
MNLVITVVAALGVIPAGLRWLRVLQREHYLPGATTQFAWRWTRSRLINMVLAGVMVAATIGSVFVPAVALVTAAVALPFPLGLTIKGRTSPLAWTRRMRTVAVVAALLAVVVIVVIALTGAGPFAAAVTVLLVPLVIDAAAAILAPYERRQAAGFVEQATRRLQRVDPRIVAITGSFGKTSTKNHIVQLVGDSLHLVATPASFNNTAGLARSVNERLEDGTEVFVAEMGTYGIGEIAAMCAWCPPQISVMTAIGPVHLERFGSLDVTLKAKSEITVSAAVVVLNADDQRLAAFAEVLEGQGKTVVRCSAKDPSADVAVLREGATWTVVVAGQRREAIQIVPGVQPTNLACAIAVAQEVGVPVETVIDRVAMVSTASNRLTMQTGTNDIVVIDNTYNSNPSSAAAALTLLVGTGRPELVVVTPGMIELGPLEDEENERFGRAIAEAGATLVVVGRTNRRALLAGARAGGATVVEVDTRDEAVARVRSLASPRHAVLYENDLPDHYP